MLTYLAIAHYGRGRGEWQESAEPAHWNTLCGQVLEEHAEGITRLWKSGVEASALPDVLSKAAMP